MYLSTMNSTSFGRCLHVGIGNGIGPKTQSSLAQFQISYLVSSQKLEMEIVL